MDAYLVVTIDTEEEGIWGGAYKREGNSVKHLYQLNKLQDLFDKYGIKPTYLVDYAVLLDDKAVNCLKKIYRNGECEIGSHLHTWCNPPFEEELTVKNTYACNLPVELVEQKLITLTNLFRKKFGFRPLSYKSGRYGLDQNQIKILKKLGYKVDTSLTPFVDYSHDGGPDFSRAPYGPYFVSEKNLFKKDKAGLLEIPATIGFTRPDFRKSAKIINFAESVHPKLVSVLARLKSLEKISLFIEFESLKNMKKIVDIYLKKKIPVIHLEFHSQNISANGTPYVVGEKNQEIFFHKLNKILDYIANKRHLKSVSCSEFYEIFRDLPKSF